MDDLIGQDIVFGADVVTWIVFVEVPAFISLVLYIIKTTRTLQSEIEQEKIYLLNRFQQLSDKLGRYKLEVAQKYASVGYLKDVESRLTNHLVRIEEKIDKRVL